MAPKKSPIEKSKTSRDGRESMKSKKLSKRRSILLEARLQRMVRKEMKKQFQQFLHTILACLMSTSGSLLNQAKSCVERKLQLHFDCKLPEELFTSDRICADGTQGNLPLRVGLLDENNNVIKEGPLSSLRIEVFVVSGDFKAEKSDDWTEEELKRSLICGREGKPLLAGSHVGTMENGVVSFNEIKFVDNSSWVPSKMFRLGAKVATSVSLPDMVEIRPGVSGAFRVKDQRGKPYEKHTVPSCDDEVWRLEKIAKDGKYHRRLEAEGISSVKDFLQMYYMDQSSLRKILGAKNKVWKAIVEHATLCSLNNEHFWYDSETGVQLLFNCVYMLVGVSFDGQNVLSLENLNEHDKWQYQIEHLRGCALEDKSKLVQIIFPAGWPSAKMSPSMVPCPNTQTLVFSANQDQSLSNMALVNSPSHPKSPSLEEATAQSIGIIGDICSLVRSDSLLRDSIIIASDNHPLSMPNFNLTWNYMLHEQASNCEPAAIGIGNESGPLMTSRSIISHMGVISPNLNGGSSKAVNLWYRVRVAVSKLLVASRGKQQAWQVPELEL